MHVSRFAGYAVVCRLTSRLDSVRDPKKPDGVPMSTKLRQTGANCLFALSA